MRHEDTQVRRGRHLWRVLLAFIISLTALATVVNAAAYVWPLGRLLDAFRQNPSRRPRTWSQRVSIVMAARNEAANLASNLSRVLAQAYPNLEVVITDDASADESLAVLAKLKASMSGGGRLSPTLRVIDQTDKTHPGKKGALARSIAEASHDWLLTTDADCRPASERWVAAMMDARGPHTEIVLGYGPQDRRPGWLNRWIRYETVYTAAQYLSAALAGRPYMGVGRNLLYHRDVYDRVGGFGGHAHLTGGDDDLLVNAGASATNTEVCLAPESWVYSAPKRTWRAYLRQKRRHVAVGLAYERSSQSWIGVLVASHVGHYAGVVALALSGWWTVALGLYAVRMAVVWWRMAGLHRGLRERDLVLWQPLLDAGVAAYYVVFGVLGLVRRKEW